MGFTNLKLYQKEVVKLLDNSFKKDRLVHTYIFAGPRGTFKKEAARYFASLVLCEVDGACGQCKECQKIASGKNPHLFYLNPDGEYIKKEQISSLEHEFSLTSKEKRVFIIDGIDKATSSSANTLLKFLEEMNDTCYGILITENINKVLPTIISRSQIINFKPINKRIIYADLIEDGLDEEEASIISTLTTNIDEAKNLANDKNLLKVIDLVRKIGFALETKDVDPILVLTEEGKLLFNESSKLYHNYFLDILITLQNDKIKHLINENKYLVFTQTINQMNITVCLDKQIKILEKIMEKKTRAVYNVNMDLLYLEMLIEIMRCINE